MGKQEPNRINQGAPRHSQMKTYIIYDEKGNERGYIKAGSHNAAEKKAKAKYGPLASVAYTEL